jgi:acyl carrier protein
MIEMNDFISKVIDQFADTDSKNIFENTEFKQLSSWDSLTSMAIVSMIEDDYGVVIEDEDIKNSHTIIDLFGVIKNKTLSK